MLEPRVDMRRPYVAGKDTVWVGWPNLYRIEKWHATQGLIDVIDRPVDWFIPWLEYVNPFEKNPGTSITNINQDSVGRLWVSILVPTYWTPIEVSGGMVPPRSEISRRYQTRVEILDVGARTVIADTIFDGLAFHWMKAGYVYRVDEDGSGSHSIQVWRPELVTHAEEPR